MTRLLRHRLPLPSFVSRKCGTQTLGNALPFPWFGPSVWSEYVPRSPRTTLIVGPIQHASSIEKVFRRKDSTAGRPFLEWIDVYGGVRSTGSGGVPSAPRPSNKRRAITPVLFLRIEFQNLVIKYISN